MNEKIKDAFAALGFQLDEVDETNYHFTYEGLHYLWITSADEEFLNIVVPNAGDKAAMDELAFYQLMDHINSTLKYVKANAFDDEMWLFYERELIGEEDFEDLLRHMIVHLEHAFRFTQASLNTDTADSDTDSEYADAEDLSAEDAADTTNDND